MRSGITIKQRTKGNKTNNKENTIHLVTGPYVSVRSHVVMFSLYAGRTNFIQPVCLVFFLFSLSYFFLKKKRQVILFPKSWWSITCRGSSLFRCKNYFFKYGKIRRIVKLLSAIDQSIWKLLCYFLRFWAR